MLRRRTTLAKCADQRKGNIGKYLFEARYTAEGARGVAREGGSGRRAAVNQAGAASVKTVVLIAPEDMDKAAKKTVDYRPPGR